MEEPAIHNDDEESTRDFRHFCVHYVPMIGALGSEVCKAGHVFKDIRRKEDGRWCYPCFQFKREGWKLTETITDTSCPDRCFPTVEEAVKTRDYVHHEIVQMFAALALTECPTHHRPIQTRQRGRNVYASPCNCLLYAPNEEIGIADVAL